MKHVTKGPKETRKLGHFLFQKINMEKHKNALVFGLEGELGAGKTTLVQGLAKVLGIKTKIKSPTFTLIKRYPIPKLNKSRFLYHIDCYRLRNHRDLLLLGIKDILKDKENIILIEWPERIKKILPKKHIKISIEHLDKNTRKIRIDNLNSPPPLKLPPSLKLRRTGRKALRLVLRSLDEEESSEGAKK